MAVNLGKWQLWLLLISIWFARCGYFYETQLETKQRTKITGPRDKSDMLLNMFANKQNRKQKTATVLIQLYAQAVTLAKKGFQ